MDNIVNDPVDIAQGIINDVKNSVDEETANRLQHQIINNTCVAEQLARLKLDYNINSYRHKIKNKPPKNRAFILLREDLKPEQLEILIRFFDKIDIVNNEISDYSPHALPRAASRAFFQDIVFNEVSAWKFPSNLLDYHKYKFLIKDIGSVPTLPIRLKLNSIHCCNPVLDISDLQRKSNFKKENNFFQYDTDHYNLCRLYNRKNYCCSNKSQDCMIKSEYLLFRHSTYDMTLEDIGKTFENSEASMAFGMMLFTPEIFVLDSGFQPDLQYYWNKERRNGKMYITFRFEYDVQPSYVHNYDTYISLVRCKAFSSNLKKKNSTNLFVFPQKMQYGMYTFKIINSDYISHDSLTNVNIRYSIPIPDYMSDKMLVRCLRYNTHVKKIHLFDRDYDRFTSVVHIIPIEFYENLMSYAISLTSAKFLIENLITAAVSFNNYTVFSGSSVKRNEVKLSVEDLLDIVIVVYFTVYSKNFERTKVASKIKQNIDKARSTSGFFKRLWHFMIRRNDFSSKNITWKEVSINTIDEKNKNYKQEDFLELLNLKNLESLSDEAHKKIYNSLFTVDKEPQKNYIKTSKMPLAFTLDQLVKNIDAVEEDTLNRLDLQDYIELEKSTNVIQSEGTACSCTEKLYVVKNSGGGNCFYYSLIQSGVFKGSVNDCKTYISSFQYIPDGFKTILDINKNRPFELNYLPHICNIFSINICLHCNDYTKIYRCLEINDNIIHLKFSNSHIELLRKFTRIPDVKTISSTDNNLVGIRALEYEFPLKRKEIKELEDFVMVNHSDCVEDENQIYLAERAIHFNSHRDEVQININYVENERDEFLTQFNYLLRKIIDNVVDYVYYQSLLPEVNNLIRKAKYNHENFDWNSYKNEKIKELISNRDSLIDETEPELYKKIKFTVDPFSNLKKKSFISRTALKAAELVQTLGLQVQEISSVYETSAAPGGVVQFFSRCTNATVLFNYFKSDIKIASELYNNLNIVDVSFDTDGDLNNIETLNVIENSILNSFPDGIELIFCDSLNDKCWKDDKEYGYLKINEVNHALRVLSIGGVMIVKFLNFFSKTTQNIIASLMPNFDRTIYKDLRTVRPTSDEFYLSFVGYNGKNLDDSQSKQLDSKILDFQITLFDYLLAKKEKVFDICNDVKFRYLNGAKVIKVYNLNEDVECLQNVLQLPEDNYMVGNDRKIVRKVTKKTLRTFNRTKNIFLNSNSEYKNFYSEPEQLLVESTIKECSVKFVDTKLTKEIEEVFYECEEAEKKDSNITDVVAFQEKDEIMINYEPPKVTTFVKPTTNNFIAGIKRIVSDRYSTLPDLVHEKEYSTSTLAMLDEVLYEGVCYTKQIHNQNLFEYKKHYEKIVATIPNFTSVKYYIDSIRHQDIGVRFSKDMLRNSFIGRNSVTDFVFDGKEFVRNINVPNSTVIIYGNYTEFMTETLINESLQIALMNLSVNPPGKIEFIQAVAGAGKTQKILTDALGYHKTNTDILMLTATSSAKLDMIDRFDTLMLNEGIDPNTFDSKNRIRTINSYLMNTFDEEKTVKASIVFVDEAVMTHPSYIIAAAMFSGAMNVYLYGDVKQIGFINYSNSEFNNVKQNEFKFTVLKVFRPVQVMNITSRCPSSVAQKLSSIYKDVPGINGLGMVSSNTGRNRESYKFITSENDLKQTSVSTHIMTFTQDEKKRLISKGLYNVKTVHESQGQTFRDVVVARLNSSAFPIYNSVPHVVTAITRHTNSLIYCLVDSVQEKDDLLFSLIKSNMHKREIDFLKYEVAGGIIKFCESKSYSSIASLNSSEVPHSFNFVLNYSQRSLNSNGKISLLMQNATIVKSKQNYVKYFVINDKHFEGIDSDRLTYLFYKKFGDSLSLRFNSFDSTKFVDYRVFDLLNRNGFISGPNKIVETSEYHNNFYKFETRNRAVLKVESSTNFVQIGLVEYFSSDIYNDRMMYAWRCNNCPIDPNLTDVKIKFNTNIYKMNLWDSYTPVLSTGKFLAKEDTTVELMLALAKRNDNVMVPVWETSAYKVADNLFDSFADFFCEREIFEELSLEINISMESIGEWLREQDSSILNLITPDFALHSSKINCYNLEMKKETKISLNRNSQLIMPTVQTICAHTKDINAIYAPVFKIVTERIKACCKRKNIIYTGMSLDTLEDNLNDLDFNLYKHKGYHLNSLKTYELDISQYDKNQHLSALLFDCKIFKHFGVPSLLIDLWFTAHMITFVFSRKSKLKKKIYYQRKSGDAWTFMGNTLFNAAMISDFFKDKLNCMDLVIVSGDDSLLFSNNSVNVDYLHFSINYNCEVKLLSLSVPYFCSKFLIFIANKVYFVPDPLKFLVKLGRQDMKSPEHIKEYWISCNDNFKNILDHFVKIKLLTGLKERYGLKNNFLLSLNFIHNIISDFDCFKELFYLKPNAVLPPNNNIKLREI